MFFCPYYQAEGIIKNKPVPATAGMFLVHACDYAMQKESFPIVKI
jgi:hypothetical protein